LSQLCHWERWSRRQIEPAVALHPERLAGSGTAVHQAQHKIEAFRCSGDIGGHGVDLHADFGIAARCGLDFKLDPRADANRRRAGGGMAECSSGLTEALEASSTWAERRRAGAAAPTPILPLAAWATSASVQLAPCGLTLR
jgi:hypothetical protein